MTTAKRNASGVYTPPYPQEVLDRIKDLYNRGDKYHEIASIVRRQFGLTRFTKNNVSGILSRLRERGEVEQIVVKQRGGRKPSRPTKHDTLAPITLPRIGGSWT